MRSKKQNNKSVVAVFAHPDDEAFGPAGTIAKFAKSHKVYLICATKGEEGGNSKNIATRRKAELEKSAQILGISRVYFLGFKDGTLSNSTYHLLAGKIEQILKILKPQSLITFEPRGISGHIDHITVSMVTTYVFKKLAFIEELLYYCISQENRESIGDYFIYFPPGYKREEIDKIINIEDEWPTKIKAITAHESQITDAKRILKRLRKLPKEEYFLLMKNK